jgi:hypothetical protein
MLVMKRRDWVLARDRMASTGFLSHAGEEGDYEERQMAMGILMTRSIKQSDGR